MLIFFLVSKEGKSALQVWGVLTLMGAEIEVEDGDKEAFRVHMAALLADVL